MGKIKQEYPPSIQPHIPANNTAIENSSASKYRTVMKNNSVIFASCTNTTTKNLGK